MTEQSGVFDGVLIGDASLAPYSASEWAARQKLLQGQGVSYPNYGVLAGTHGGTYPALSVQATSPISSNVEVQIGAALVAGYLYENTAALTLAVGANASGNPRIDTLVLRADFVGQTIRAAIKQGTPAGSPVRPTLQQDTLIWEIPLADIAVANGFSTLAQTTITNRQRAMHSLNAGWMVKAFPFNYDPGTPYTGTSSNLTTAAASLATPILFGGNINIDSVDILHLTTAITYDVSWGIYTQPTNDMVASESVLRLVASGRGTGTTLGSQTISLPATPKAQALPPGFYWIVIRWNGGSAGGLNLGAISSLNLAGNIGRFFSSTISGDTPQTIDLTAAGWNNTILAHAIVVRGLVFGMTTPL